MMKMVYLNPSEYDSLLRRIKMLTSELKRKDMDEYVVRYVRPLETEIECDKAHAEDINWEAENERFLQGE